jgi:serine/threonine protein phosphatase 1
MSRNKTIKANKMHRKTLEPNVDGRDFVVGDLHGCFTRLGQLLDHVNFDDSKDRLISVGDLVDRGPENEQCLRLLGEPWFFSVQGNHEQLMSQFYYPENGPYGEWWPMNGGMWGVTYGNRDDPNFFSDIGMEMRDLAKTASELPLMITVEMKDGRRFHVLHAELSAIEELTDEQLMDDAKFKEAAFQQTMDGDFITWGRFIFYSLYNRNLDRYSVDKYLRTAETHKFGKMFGPNLSHIYSGHTIMQAPVRYRGQTNIDTGAFISMQKDAAKWAGLTMTEPLTDKFWMASAEGVCEINPVVIE